MTLHLPTQPSEADEFRQFYNEGFSRVWNLVRRMGVPAADREDVVQEVFVVAFRRADDRDVGRPAAPWLAGITARVAMAYFRKRKRHPGPTTEAPEIASTAPSPEHITSDNQARDLLRQALETLSTDRRAVFVLHYIEDLPVPEVAEALGVPLNTAYSRIRRARADVTSAIRSLQGSQP